MRWRLALLLAAAIGNSAAHAQLSCGVGQKDRAVAELMFGRKIGDRIGVSQAAWTKFLDREVTPRFPDGLTVVDANGQWLDPARKKVVREPSKIVTIVLRDAAADQARIDLIADAYKRRFRQQSVGVIVRQACVGF